jgi:hypothetical protein
VSPDGGIAMLFELSVLTWTSTNIPFTAFSRH